MSRLIREAADTNTALELNAYVDRLDLAVPYVREAVGAGVSITIDTDAHDERALGFMKYGVSQARRAWVEKGSVINCLPFDEFEKYLKYGSDLPGARPFSDLAERYDSSGRTLQVCSRDDPHPGPLRREVEKDHSGDVLSGRALLRCTQRTGVREIRGSRD